MSIVIKNISDKNANLTLNSTLSPPLPSSHLAIMVLPFSSATLDYQVQGWDPGVEVAWVLSNPLLDIQQQNQLNSRSISNT